MKHIVLSVLTALSVSAFAELPQPYGYWKMDEISANRTVADASGNGLDLTLGDGVSLVDDAMFGKVLRWEGTRGSWAVFSNPALADRTISIWFNRDADDADVDAENNNKIPNFFSNWSTMTINYGKNSLGFNIAVAGLNYYSAVSPSRSAWHQLTLTFGDSRWYDEAQTNHVGTLRVYLDGVQVKSYEDVVTKSTLMSAGNCILGNSTTNQTSSDPRPFKGYFSKIRVWGEALSEAEVVGLYLDDVKKANRIPLGRWKLEAMEEGDSGETLFVPEGDAAVDLVNGGNAVTVYDGEMGCQVAQFPNYATGSYAKFELPDSTANFSFGMWLNIPDNLLEIGATATLDNAAKTNICPSVYAFGSYSRLSMEYSRRNSNSINGNFYDIGTLDNPVDVGFEAATITVQKGRWSHLGVTLETTFADGLYAVTPRIYVDGVCVRTGDVQTAKNYSGAFSKGTSFILGSGSTSAVRSLCGKIADFTAYAGLLSDGEMAELARGMPTVDAGGDFSLAVGRTGRLKGGISLTGRMGNRRAAKVKTSWTMVFCPEGGETAEITMAESLHPVIRLPAVGKYVFRLTAVSTALGISECDEVTVNCVAPDEGGSMPTVTVSGESAATNGIPLSLAAAVADPGSASVGWKFVSGPGAVAFEPAFGTETKVTFHAVGEYKLVAVASDGQNEAESEPFTVTVEEGAAVDLESGLIAYWPFDVSCKEVFSGTSYSIDRYQKQSFEKGADGYGVRCHGAFYPYINTGLTLLETTSDSENSVPYERYRAFSLWMYHDPADTNNSKCATLVSVAYSLGLWYNCQDGLNGFTMYQQILKGPVGNGNVDEYGMPPVNPEGRWTHVYALFDRTTIYTSNTSELWIDGVKMTNRTKHGMGGGRVRENETIMIGGHKSNGENHNGHFKDADGNLLSRTFPGVIDEVRMYNRKLTEAEIRFLAANPVVDVNRAPAVSVPPSEKKVLSRKVAAISAATGDDGKPDGGLAGCWRVVEGDASAVFFADATAAETTFTATKAGMYRLSYVVSDGEKEAWSEPLAVSVERSGMTVTIR